VAVVFVVVDPSKSSHNTKIIIMGRNGDARFLMLKERAERLYLSFSQWFFSHKEH